MQLLKVLVVLLLADPLIGQAFEYKDLKLGEQTTVETVEKVLGGKCEPHRNYDNAFLCKGVNTILGEETKVAVVLRFQIINTIILEFTSQLNDELRDVLIGKYGPPSRISGKQRMFVETRTFIWEDGDSKMTLYQDPDNYKISNIFMYKLIIDPEKKKADEIRRKDI